MSTRPKVEATVQVVILLAVGGMAGAASFTHVHDWTMANSPHGTPHWFGWANAVISELTPIAAGLEARRRKVAGLPVRYPVAVLVAAVLLSLAAQVAVAKPGLSGWLLSSVPALAFMALIKLVISSPRHSVPSPDLTPAPVEPVTVPTRVNTPATATAPVPAPERGSSRSVLPISAETFARPNGVSSQGRP